MPKRRRNFLERLGDLLFPPADDLDEFDEQYEAAIGEPSIRHIPSRQKPAPSEPDRPSFKERQLAQDRLRSPIAPVGMRRSSVDIFDIAPRIIAATTDRAVDLSTLMACAVFSCTPRGLTTPYAWLAIMDACYRFGFHNSMLPSKDQSPYNDDRFIRLYLHGLRHFRAEVEQAHRIIRHELQLLHQAGKDIHIPRAMEIETRIALTKDLEPGYDSRGKIVTTNKHIEPNHPRGLANPWHPDAVGLFVFGWMSGMRQYVAYDMPGFALDGLNHTGEDGNLPHNRDLGAPIYASAPGTVVAAGEGAGRMGLRVMLHHELDGVPIYPRHMHCAKLLVREGQKVIKKQKIATIGESGNWPAHDHYDVARKPTPDEATGQRGRAAVMAKFFDLATLHS